MNESVTSSTDELFRFLADQPEPRPFGRFTRIFEASESKWYWLIMPTTSDCRSIHGLESDSVGEKPICFVVQTPLRPLDWLIQEIGDPPVELIQDWLQQIQAPDSSNRVDLGSLPISSIWLTPDGVIVPVDQAVQSIPETERGPTRGEPTTPWEYVDLSKDQTPSPRFFKALDLVVGQLHENSDQENSCRRSPVDQLPPKFREMPLVDWLDSQSKPTKAMPGAANQSVKHTDTLKTIRPEPDSVIPTKAATKTTRKKSRSIPIWAIASTVVLLTGAIAAFLWINRGAGKDGLAQTKSESSRTDGAAAAALDQSSRDKLNSQDSDPNDDADQPDLLSEPTDVASSEFVLDEFTSSNELASSDSNSPSFDDLVSQLSRGPREDSTSLASLFPSAPDDLDRILDSGTSSGNHSSDLEGLLAEDDSAMTDIPANEAEEEPPEEGQTANVVPGQFKLNRRLVNAPTRIPFRATEQSVGRFKLVLDSPVQMRPEGAVVLQGRQTTEWTLALRDEEATLAVYLRSKPGRTWGLTVVVRIQTQDGRQFDLSQTDAEIFLERLNQHLAILRQNRLVIDAQPTSRRNAAMVSNALSILDEQIQNTVNAVQEWSRIAQLLDTFFASAKIDFELASSKEHLTPFE